MKISYDELFEKKHLGLYSEILSSIPKNIIDKLSDDRVLDVKLLIDDIEVDPTMLNDIIDNIDDYIKNRANKYLSDKLYEAREKIDKLNTIIDEFSETIICHCEYEE